MINPAKIKIFYGWPIIILGGIGVIMSAPGQTIGFSTFRNYVQDDLNLSIFTLGMAYSIGTMASGFLAVQSGRLYDKYGARIMASVAGFSMALAMLYISITPKLFTWLNLFENNRLNTSVKVLLIAVGMFALRFFGQGMLTLVSRNMVMKWFDTRRGIANLLVGAMVAFGFSAAPHAFQQWINRFGWEHTYQLLAILSGGIFVILALLFFRDNPQKYGLQPDGNWHMKNNHKQGFITNRHFRLNEAKGLYSFWALNLVLSMFAFYLTGFTFYFKDIFGIAGHTLNDALSIFMPFAVVAVVVEVVGSLLADHYKMKYFIAFMALGILITVSGAMFLPYNLLFKYLIIAGNGMAIGMFGIVGSISWPRFFGTRYLGEITGFNMSWMVIASALAPLLFGLNYQLTKNFNACIYSSLLIIVLLLIGTFKAENPNNTIANNV